MNRNTSAKPVLSVSNLNVNYRTPDSSVQVLKDVAFELHPGRILGVAGESGSGKSTAATSALGWNTPTQARTGGESLLGGVDLFGLSERDLRDVWGRRIGYVPQEIGGALHPIYRIRTQFRESLRINAGLDKAAADERAIELLDAARVPKPAQALRRFPHEFSGGQLQRIAIALALAPRPELLILDEPTTGLDVTTQEVVAAVLRELVDDHGVAALFITHDLALLAELADDIAIMYAGEIVETGPTCALVTNPKHPYSRALLDAVPSAETAITPEGIPGLPPGRVVTDRCCFAQRCDHRIDACERGAPPLVVVGDRRSTRCIRAHDLALPTRVSVERSSHTRDTQALLEVNGLTCVYPSAPEPVVAVNAVNLVIHTGQVSALVGESGSGKTTLGKLISGIEHATSGTIRLDGNELPADPSKRTRQQRRDIQLIFQNATASLNPRRKVGDHLQHVASKFFDVSDNELDSLVAEALDDVQMSVTIADRYPSQLSGGQRQRVAIAAAFVARPRIVICDEITSGQDVSVQAAILQTLADLQEAHDTSVLFISHDLGVVRSIADSIYVMRSGHIVESGASESVFTSPQHTYTKELLAAVPRLEAASEKHVTTPAP